VARLDRNASDYACAGGIGDSPKYKGRVAVIGFDPYDLDAHGEAAGAHEGSKKEKA